MKFTFIRMSKLLDVAIEQDEIFWNQDALKEVLLVFCLFLCTMQVCIMYHPTRLASHLLFSSLEMMG